MAVNVDKIRELMVEKCLTVRALSTSSGVSESALNNILNRNVTPTLATIGKISKALGVPGKELMA